jgi:hypothetical protein
MPTLLLLLCCCAAAAAPVLCNSYYGVKPVVLPKMAHDVMLDTRWETAADSLRGWLDATY